MMRRIANKRAAHFMQFEFYKLDVFTSTPYAGNPLAVVLEAGELDGARMQQIAREFNLSETIFVLPPDNPVHTAKVRIFTRFEELPFAGHPTIGAAVLLAQQKFAAIEREEDAIVVLEEGIGPVRVGVRLRPGEAAFAEFDAATVPEQVGEPAPTDRLAAALGLAPNEIGFENHKPTRYSAGLPFTFVPVQGLDAIGDIEIRMQYWQEAFGGNGPNAAFVYCRETVHRRSAFHARAFVPSLLGAEDAATGSAAAAFAGVIQQFDDPPDGVHNGLIEQGYEMGRPAEISLELELEAGEVHVVRIGGNAVPVMEGRLEA